MKFINSKTVKDEYENWHSKFHGKDNLDQVILFEWHYNVINKIGDLEILKGKRVLEVGCGVGDFSIYLSNYAFEVIGIDFSAEAIRIGNEKIKCNNSKAILKQMDAQNLLFNADEFDIIISCECLEHLPDPKSALNEMYRVLKPGGNIILTTENYSNAMAYLVLYNRLINRPYDSGSGVQPIENFFVFWKVKKMFKDAGFSKIRTSGSHHIFLLLPGFSPHTFVVNEFKRKFWKILFKPLARHMLFYGIKGNF